MSDSPTCKQQKTAKEEEAPKNLLSLLIEMLQYCISFVGKGHYRFVGSICKRINKIYANEDEDMKLTFWSNVAVSKDLAELCLQDHQKLGRTQNEIPDLFLDVARKGHLRVLEIAHSNRLEWYIREMLEEAVARFDVQLLYFIFDKKPDEFDLSFTRLCVSKGYFYTLNWWKRKELLELFCDAAYNGQCKIMESLKYNGWQQRPTSLERNVVNLAARGGHINALEWARDQGWYGDEKESCMWAAKNGHLHVLQWL